MSKAYHRQRHSCTGSVSNQDTLDFIDFAFTCLFDETSQLHLCAGTIEAATLSILRPDTVVVPCEDTTVRATVKIEHSLEVKDWIVSHCFFCLSSFASEALITSRASFAASFKASQYLGSPLVS